MVIREEGEEVDQRVVVRETRTERYTTETNLTDGIGWVMGLGSMEEQAEDWPVRGSGPEKHIESRSAGSLGEGVGLAEVPPVLGRGLWREKSWIYGRRTWGMGGWGRHPRFGWWGGMGILIIGTVMRAVLEEAQRFVGTDGP